MCFTLVSYLACSSALKMEATCSSEPSVDLKRTAWRYTPEDGTLHSYHCENLKFYSQMKDSRLVITDVLRKGVMARQYLFAGDIFFPLHN
jgi:hypothetical protein